MNLLWPNSPLFETWPPQCYTALNLCQRTFQAFSDSPQILDSRMFSDLRSPFPPLFCGRLGVHSYKAVQAASDGNCFYFPFRPRLLDLSHSRTVLADSFAYIVTSVRCVSVTKTTKSSANPTTVASSGICRANMSLCIIFYRSGFRTDLWETLDVLVYDSVPLSVSNHNVLLVK